MTRYFKTKLKTPKKVAEALKAMAGTYRKIWNYAMDCQECWLGLSRVEYLHYMKTAQLYDYLIKARDTVYPFVRNMDGGMIKAVSLKANESFKRWFDSYPHSTKYRRPRYLSRKKDLMSFKTQGNIRIFNDYIEIPKLGKVKLYEKNYLPVNKKFTNTTFSYDGNNWWISFEINENTSNITDLDGEATLDFNKNGDILLQNRIIKSTTNEKSQQRATKRQRKLLKKLKRQSIANIERTEKSLKTRTSKNMIKTKKQLLLVKTRLENLRKDNFRKQASILTRTKLATVRCLSPLGIKKERQSGLTRIMREKHTLDFFNTILKKFKTSGTKIETHDSFDERLLKS